MQTALNYKNLDEQKSLNELLSFLKRVGGDDRLTLCYVLKAWQVLSSKLPNELSFENFYSKKVSFKELSSIFAKLGEFKIFRLYTLEKINDSELVQILNYVKDKNLPSVNVAFFQNRELLNDDLAKFALEILGADLNNIYVPFVNGFSYAYVSDANFYADYDKNEIIAELANVIDGTKVNFYQTNALTQPKFTNENAPHILRQFDYSLSFLPIKKLPDYDPSEDKFNRFSFQTTKHTQEITLLEHILAQTSKKSAVFTLNNFTFKSGLVYDFRKFLIEQNHIEAVISLPRNLVNGVLADLVLLIFNKQKSDDFVWFIDLKNGDFVKKDGRKFSLTNTDFILKNYKKNVDKLSQNVQISELKSQDYTLSAERFIINNELKSAQNRLKNFNLTTLEKIAQTKKSQLINQSEEGDLVYEILPSDFSEAGFTQNFSKQKLADKNDTRLKTYALKPYDLLLCVRGNIGKVAILGEISDNVFASQATQIIRLNSQNKDEAIALYMFLKSEIAQSVFRNLQNGTLMPQLLIKDIKELKVPIFSPEQIEALVRNFNAEISLFNELNELKSKIDLLHKNFI
ncbi:N-6 DNA methylase [Campylobacter gastrosuis]|uniref:site-specific DNA-methyltransferase (adenine-specific) n=1 Tax=Campylobacter gastrosuis TaxID=2974576 RepID=A0ABT7HNA5_9BACT|nr:N-6 DNA methylase [Campylobacter gastrosuis]MDL0088255.1 N-6 DNA methylase [Campylobacter gastrosuis]